MVYNTFLMKLYFALAWVLTSLAAPSLHAELPPSVYEEKQKSAPEFLTLEVLRVEIEPGEEVGQQRVNVVALVSEVTRSATDLKPEAIINLSYLVTERPRNFVGPGEIPILEEGQSTIAYLEKNTESGTYTPVAGVMSFSQF